MPADAGGGDPEPLGPDEHPDDEEEDHGIDDDAESGHMDPVDRCEVNSIKQASHFDDEEWKEAGDDSGSEDMDHSEFGSFACDGEGGVEDEPHDGEAEVGGGGHGHILGDAF